ncbi:MAG: hypothetical protein Q9208_003594 [Pyrenodesmia sp. 3 TL-2023]
MDPKGPPKTYDISHMFEPVDRHDIGGTGNFNAGVFIVRHRRTGKVLVEKRYKPDEVQNDGAAFEMFVVRELPHPNIVRYITGFIDEQTHRVPRASLYMEHYDLGTLQKFLNDRARTPRPFGEAAIWDIFMQLVKGVAFMQYGVQDACMGSPVPPGWIGVVHRDIKLDNIFLKRDRGSGRFRLVLGDFGQAIREDDDGNWGRQYLNGNMATMPPEVSAGNIGAYSYESDVWAVGWCMASLCQLTNAPRLSMYAGPAYSRALNRAIGRLLQVDPGRRPPMHMFARSMPDWEEEGLAEGAGMVPRPYPMW